MSKLRSGSGAALLALLIMSAGARAGGYAPEQRAAHVQQALTALVALGADRDRLEVALATAARQRCGATGNQVPKLPCLLEVGAQLCRGGSYGGAETCAAAVDVMLVNLRSAGDLVDEATRVRLVRGAADYHAALLVELRKRYAALAAEWILEDPEAGAVAPASAPSLDRFCARRDYRPKPPRCDQLSETCVPSLSWQRCVAALAWFVTSPPLPAGAGSPASASSPSSSSPPSSPSSTGTPPSKAGTP